MPLSLSPSLLMSSASSVAFSPLSLFASGEQGAWYDPSDLTTMFQDTAGTTPVTATGQTVARINDKSGRGNHATQATAASRPIYGIEPFGGRRNLLTYTEQFDNVVWTKASATVTPDNATAPNGTTTADLLIPTAINNDHGVYRSVALSANSVVSVYAKQGPGIYKLALHPDGGNTRAVFNLQTGVVDVNDSGQTATITSVGDGWYRASLTVSSAATFIKIYVANASNQVTFIGDGTSGILIWGAQLELGSTATAYQRVTDQWNVTQAGVPSVSYLAFDGTDDFLLTGTITPGIDKAQVFAGVRKLSDALFGVVTELSAAVGSNNGAMGLFAPDSTSAGFAYRSRGTLGPAAAQVVSPAAPTTTILTGIGDIAGDVATLRINGAQVATSTTDQGTGNYLAYPLYIGRRGGTTQPLNGRIYQMLVRFGANLSAATITQTETFVNSRTGAY